MGVIIVYAGPFIGSGDAFFSKTGKGAGFAG